MGIEIVVTTWSNCGVSKIVLSIVEAWAGSRRPGARPLFAAEFCKRAPAGQLEQDKLLFMIIS